MKLDVELTSSQTFATKLAESQTTILTGLVYKLGEDGMSAYEVAVKNGFEGTEQEWLNSLNGYTPIRGTDYWTDDDKADIVNLVLAEFTDVAEVGQ